PITASEYPYIGDESIIAPARAKNSCTTGTSGASFVTSGATLNVIHVPSPMTGNRSPVLGIARVMGVRSFAAATRGNACAVAAAAIDPRKLRRAWRIGLECIAVRLLVAGGVPT